MPKDKVIIANMSGFYGDRLSAAKEMVQGGPIDFLTGDYLAELTMAILYKSKAKRPEAGYAVTFLKQMEQIMGECLDKGIKVVANAGGLNPKGLAEALRSMAHTLHLDPSIAYVEGDDLMPRMEELRKDGVVLKHLDNKSLLSQSDMLPLTANAYLGCWGIVKALEEGADIVVTGRVADTSVVMGPAAYHFGWKKDNWDALANAAAVGHIIECGGQATGGNFSHFKSVKSYTNIGFPIAEIMNDGSAIISKHPNTGGLVDKGTITAQLLYEINHPQYITPDVVAHFDTLQLEELGNDKVRISNTKGSASTDTAKVTINTMGGFQNKMTYLIAGLDIEEKVKIITETTINNLGGEENFDKLDIQYWPTHKMNPMSQEEAMAQLQIYVQDKDPTKAGKYFTSKIVELALCSVPGICWSSAPAPARPRIVHFPSLIDKKHLIQKVNVDGKEFEIQEIGFNGNIDSDTTLENKSEYHEGSLETSKTFIGRLYAARSGDKGGNANLGIWGQNSNTYDFLKSFLTTEKLKELMPETKPYQVVRYDFPNLLGLNFYIIGFLGDGVAASTKMDAQAKSLGEYLRAKEIDIPNNLCKYLIN